MSHKKFKRENINIMTNEKKPRQKKVKIVETDIPLQETIERSREQSNLALKRKVRIFYDLQRLRLQTAGRTALPTPRTDPGDQVEAEIMAKAETGEAKRKIDLHPADQAVLDLRAQELMNAEKVALKDVQSHLDTIGFYRDVISDKVRYRGIGPTMAGVILAEFDIFRLETPSQMWAFAGLAPVAAMRCSACHMVVEQKNGSWVHVTKKTRNKSGEEVDTVPKFGCKGKPPPDVYVSGKAMKPTKGEKLRYNAFLRSKLCGVLGGVLLKVNSPWRKFYDDYKHRKQTAGWGVSDAHRHAASVRYMVKMLLLDIWTRWREYEKLPIRPSYQEEKLGHKHGGGILENNVSPRDEVEMTPELAAEIENAAQ